jgi:TnpA family transposase
VVWQVRGLSLSPCVMHSPFWGAKPYEFFDHTGVRLMPRLKRLKYERLYLPDTGMASAFPNLASVLSRPIRWELMAQQYDEMIKHAVALKLGTATPEAILKQFNSYNVTHPTYKALAELGKVEKTIYLCEYLSSLALRHEVEAGLNVVER